MSDIRLPAGVRDFLPRAAARRRAIAERLLETFEAWGYQRLITPVFECADVLERGLGADARAAAIRFVEPGSGEVVALRPDITPQVARIVATRLADVDGPIRLCYEGAVNRLPQPGTGPLAQRELLQAGIELIDAGSPDGDAEALAVAAAALATTGLEHVRLDVGHVAPAKWVLGQAPDALAREKLKTALSRKDKAAVAKAATALPSTAREAAEALPRLWGPARDVLDRARHLKWPHEVEVALGELADVLAAAGPLVEPTLHDEVTIDLGEVRGFEYYTGIRFAGWADGAADAIVRGGRYDELVGRYGRAAKATGFAVDIEAIATAQRASGMAPPAGATSVLFHAEGKQRQVAHRLARALRGKGFRAAVDLAHREHKQGLPAYGKGVGFDVIVELGRAPKAIETTTGKASKLDAAAIERALAGDAAALAQGLRRIACPS
ncbi:MAG TPA: ATP phosphoribosyltransferase regulatory subunit [Kofleriaceae bacterium]|nr:ATP phosphoribosyltransferase regulatory subunit [Kofleriaceae bacterium]